MPIDGHMELQACNGCTAKVLMFKFLRIISSMKNPYLIITFVGCDIELGISKTCYSTNSILDF